MSEEIGERGSMLKILSKPADQINLGDIHELIEAKVPEGQQLEFKEALSTKKGKSSEHALLEEVVAFANAQGGTLLLGIKESSGKPSIASEMTPVSSCEELADRLGKMLRDCVEPKIPAIEVFGIPVEKDGSGIVIIRVGRSRLAPHWVKNNRACKIRRADRSEQMTMWEVQDMTLNVSRGMEGFKKRLRERSKRFQQEFDNLNAPEESFGIRVTALPVGGDVRFDRVYPMREDLLPSWEPVSEKNDDGKNRELDAPPNSFLPQYLDWQPMLRSTRRSFATPKEEPLRMGQVTSSTDVYSFSYQELHCDGTLELGYLSVKEIPRNGLPDQPFEVFFDPDWPLVLLAETIMWATQIRSHSSAPMAEYGLQIEIQCRGEKTVHTRKNRSRPHSSIQDLLLDPKVPIHPVIFPNYPLDHEETPAILLQKLLQTFNRDFWNCLGKDCEKEFEVGKKQQV